ncbi:unnamed protein product, partial [Prorocentrum cordatum]
VRCQALLPGTRSTLYQYATRQCAEPEKKALSSCKVIHFPVYCAPASETILAPMDTTKDLNEANLKDALQTTLFGTAYDYRDQL